SYAGLEQKVEDRTRELTDALEQQTATAEILRVISSSPTDVQPVLESVAAKAARLCDASDALIFRRDGDVARLVARYGSIPAQPLGWELPVSRGSVSGRALVDRETVHIPDLWELSEEYPQARTL